MPPLDRNGRELKVGDRVRIEARVSAFDENAVGRALVELNNNTWDFADAVELIQPQPEHGEKPQCS